MPCTAQCVIVSGWPMVQCWLPYLLILPCLFHTLGILNSTKNFFCQGGMSSQSDHSIPKQDFFLRFCLNADRRVEQIWWWWWWWWWPNLNALLLLNLCTHLLLLTCCYNPPLGRHINSCYFVIIWTFHVSCKTELLCYPRPTSVSLSLLLFRVYSMFSSRPTRVDCICMPAPYQLFTCLCTMQF